MRLTLTLLFLFFSFPGLAQELQALKHGELRYSATGQYKVIFTPHQIQVFSGESDQPFTQLTQSQSPFFEHLIWSQDDSVLGVQAPNKTKNHIQFHLYDFPQLKYKSTLTLPSSLASSSSSFTLSPQGRYLATVRVLKPREKGYFIAHLSVWDTHSHQRILYLPAFQFRNTSGHSPDFQVAFAPQGRYLTVGMDWDMGASPPVKSKLKVWDLIAQKWVYWLDGNHQFQYARKRPYLLFFQGPKTSHTGWQLKRWSLFYNRFRTVPLPMDPRFYEQVLFSPNGQYVMSVQRKNTVNIVSLWQISPFKKHKEWIVKDGFSSARFHPNERHVIFLNTTQSQKHVY